MATWPKLPEVRSWLRLQPDPVEDLVIDSARMAAIAWGNRRTNLKYDPNDPDNPDPVIPDDIHEACVMHAARLYRRRDSVDGSLGGGEWGIVRVGRVDPDILALYDGAAPMIFG
jgi:hypothetical protein